MIDAAIKSIVKELSPAEGHDLVAWEYEVINSFDLSDTIKYELDDEGFVLSELNEKNKERMFKVHLKATKKARNLDDVRKGLIKGWKFLQYIYFQASLVEVYKDCAVLKFVTVIAEREYYVTGKAVVKGKRYKKLAKMHKPDCFQKKLFKYRG